MYSSTTDNKHKIIIIGDSYIGKTSLIYSYINNSNQNQDNTNYKKIPKITIGTEYTETFFPKYNLHFHLWDCAGQERFKAVTRLYYRGCVGCILMFDLSNIKTLISLETYWIKAVLDNTEEPPLFLLIGNKSDLIKTVDPHIENIVNQICNKYNATYIETSVLNNTNIIKAFTTFASQIYSLKQPLITNDVINLNYTNESTNNYLNNIYSYC
jgi:small GTP-binding protein